MRIKTGLIILASFFLCSAAIAKISTEELAKRAETGVALYELALADRDNKLLEIMNDLSRNAGEKQKAVENLQNAFLKKSREIHYKYREPFIQRVIAETNQNLPMGGKIKPGLGSGIYKRHKITGKVLKDAQNRAILNPEHRGIPGDLDIAGNPRAVKKLEETFKHYGVSMSSNNMEAPGSRDFKSVEVTINVSGGYDQPGSSSHETRVKMDAMSKETYVSVSMKENQAGKSLVKTQDHIKKAAKGLSQPAKKLLGAQGEGLLQGVSKGTLKSIKSGAVTDVQLDRILKDSGYKGNAIKFKKQIKNLKLGHLHQGVGLDENNIQAFQNACKATTEQALDNAEKKTASELADLQTRIDAHDAKARSGNLSKDEIKQHQRLSKTLRNELNDSKIKIKQTALANEIKLKGGNYEDFFRKTDARPVKPKVSTPKLSRVDAIKKGLKPGLLDVAGYGMSGYNVYKNVSDFQNGKISKNDAVIGVTSEVVDTGMGMVSSVGSAAAVGTIGTGLSGTVATVGAPIVVTAAAGYAVKNAVVECLETYEAFKIEEISHMVAKSKKEEVVNKYQLKAESLIKRGVMTGDWRYFEKADDIATSLLHLYSVTGDKDYGDTFHKVFDRLTQKKEMMEKKYNTSIYDVKSKMVMENKQKAGRNPAERTVQADEAQESPSTEEIKEKPRTDQMPEFDIQGYFENYGGDEIPASVENGDILAFEARVPHYESDIPRVSTLFWQVYDNEGTPINGLGKTIQTYESHGTKTYKTRFRLNNLSNGTYTMGLHHSLDENPDISFQAKCEFTIFQTVRLTKLVTSRSKESPSHESSFVPGKKIYCFAYYELAKGVEGAHVSITAKNSRTKAVILSKSGNRPLKGSPGNQRVGIALEPEILPPGHDYEIMVDIQSGDGKTISRTAAFSVSNYRLAVTIPARLDSGKPKGFSLKVPDCFTPPYQVNIDVPKYIGLGYNKGELQGSVTGISNTDKFVDIKFCVIDAKGLTAKAGKRVKIMPISAQPRQLPVSSNLVPGPPPPRPSGGEWIKKYDSKGRLKREFQVIRDNSGDTVMHGQDRQYNLFIKDNISYLWNKNVVTTREFRHGKQHGQSIQYGFSRKSKTGKHYLTVMQVMYKNGWRQSRKNYIYGCNNKKTLTQQGQYINNRMKGKWMNWKYDVNNICRPFKYKETYH